MITLIGHGYVGNYIQQELQSQNILHTWIRHTDPIPLTTSCIINAAGYTGVPNVDACELNKQATIQGNVIWPLSLEQANPSIPIVHITSGCVYTGLVSGGYTELDEPNFTFDNGSFYSGSKALFQKLMTPYLDKSYLLRIRMPFGDDNHSKNLLTKFRNYDKLIDFHNSLSYIVDVARVAVYFAVNRPQAGIYNVCNPGALTTKQIADILGLTKQWFTPEEFDRVVVAPRSVCELNVDKLQRIFPLESAETILKRTVVIDR